MAVRVVTQVNDLNAKSMWEGFILAGDASRHIESCQLIPGIFHKRRVCKAPCCDICILLKMLHVLINEDRNKWLCLSIIWVPCDLCGSISSCCISRSSTDNIPPGSHGEKVVDLMSPSRVIGRANENGSSGLDGWVDVERQYGSNKIKR